MEDGGVRFGHWKPLPKSRRFVVDYLHYARKVPSQPLMRQCRIPELVELRARANRRIGWSTLFLKAYALLAARHPQLRSFLMTWPWMHVYEHPHQVARVAVSRRYRDEDWLFFCRIEKPDQLDLAEIQEQIEKTQTAEVKEIPLFKLHRLFSGLPWILRRSVWWLIMSLSGGLRAGLTGTYGMTSVSSLGAVSINPPTLGNIVVTYGPVDANGEVRVTFVYDHRLFDGATVARYLREFEEVLNGLILNELKTHCQESRDAA